MAQTVVVIGGGITGLAAAFTLKRRGREVILLEEADRVGGVIRSGRVEGFLVENGPNSTLETNPAVTALVRDVGMEGEKLYASDASKNRYILRGGRLIALPMSPIAFVTSPLFTARGKLRLLTEPFAPPPAKADETLAEFVARRVGREFLDYAVNPFIAGVYAGDPRRLSVRDALPKLHSLEEKYGGLIRGMIKGRKERRARGEESKQSAKMFSFQEGMSRLPVALHRALGDSVRLGVRVESLRHEAGRYRIAFREGGVEADEVLLAASVERSADLLEGIDRGVAERMRAIPSAPVAVVYLGFDRHPSSHPLDGFGFLVPEVERRRILGAIFTSTIFPNRVPSPGCVALTLFVGGMRQPELVGMNDEDLTEMAIGELTDLIGLRVAPMLVRIARHRAAIPQYHVGHGAILGAIGRMEADHPGLRVLGSFRGGISVADCAASAAKVM